MQWRARTWWWLCWILNVMSWEVIVQYLIWSTLYIICTKEWVIVAPDEERKAADIVWIEFSNKSYIYSSLFIKVAWLVYLIIHIVASLRVKNGLIILWIVWSHFTYLDSWKIPDCNWMTLSHTRKQRIILWYCKKEIQKTLWSGSIPFSSHASRIRSHVTTCYSWWLVIWIRTTWAWFHPIWE